MTKTIVAGPNEQLQADLMDVRSYASANDGYSFILTVLDCFARKAWAVPLKSKADVAVSEALDEILRETRFTRLQTD